MLQNRIITKPENVYYLTGFYGSEASFWFFLETKSGQKFLVTDHRYLVKAKKVLAGRNIEIALMGQDFKAQFADQFHGEFLCEKSLTIAQLEMLKRWFENIKFVPSDDLIEKDRLIKRPAEIKDVAYAQNHVDQVLIPFLQQNLKLGVREKVLQFHLENTLKSQNKFGLSFEPIVAFGENSAIPHHSSGERELQLGDNILIDCGITFNRYCSDMTRNFVIGEPKPEYLKRYQGLLKVQLKTLPKFKTGTAVKAIDDYARDLMGDQVDFYTHGLGHGVGLEVHEAPRVSHRSAELLKTDQIATCEPGLYYEDKFGIRIEDLLVVKRGKPQILSKTTKDLISFDGQGNAQVVYETPEI